MGFNQNKLLVMLLTCRSISSPYKGPHTESLIVTYYLYDNEGKEYRWHEGPNKALGCKVGDVLDGIVIKEKSDKNFKKSIVDYKKSNPVVVYYQTSIKI